ncbi:MAG: triose-phosphate isomerase [Myxococcales bacterium]|nr:triose-phosphate isomerase [Myxococcales bacterium]USN50607.1 MAG: triose-phosphate isomerase [Myxococcales bacterium]
MGSKKPLLIANWKLHHSKASAGDFFERVVPVIAAVKHVDLAIAPVALMLDFSVQKLCKSSIKVAAQNVFYEEKGAFTGEWSVAQLREIGVSMAIVGHSERRSIFKESDSDVAKKARACLLGGLTPIICVGESLKERDEGQLEAVLNRQCQLVMEHIKDLDGEIIFAYEPLWAIGTGRSASAKEADEAHGIIFKILDKRPAKVIYGGSVKADNIREIVAMPHVDGALVGGASLQVESFLSMVKELNKNELD